VAGLGQAVGEDCGAESFGQADAAIVGRASFSLGRLRFGGPRGQEAGEQSKRCVIGAHDDGFAPRVAMGVGAEYIRDWAFQPSTAGACLLE
jgi:hypothetical protein